MSSRASFFDQQVILMLGLHEPMEPKHRDISVVTKVGEGYTTKSFNVPSTHLLETRIGFLAREAMNEMAVLVHRIGGNTADLLPAEEVRKVRNEFARGEVRVQVVLGTTRGGTNVDSDNCLKLVLDALSPVVFPNDRHVTNASIKQNPHVVGAIFAPTWVLITREGDERKEKDKLATGVYAFPARNAHKLSADLPILNEPTRP